MGTNGQAHSLGDFLREVILDCWHGRLNEATVSATPCKTGTFPDGSTTYEVEYVYKFKDVNSNSGERRYSENGITLDANDTPGDYAPGVEKVLRDHGVPARAENGTVRIGIMALREPDMYAETVADLLSAGGRKVHAQDVIREICRMKHGPAPRLYNGRNLMAIGQRMGMSEDEILASIKSYFGRNHQSHGTQAV